MNKRQKQKIKMKEKRLRKEFWPDIKDEDLWIRTEEDGFTTIPRTMPLIAQIMDDLSTGKPVSSTYITLWCRVFDSCMIKIDLPKQYAYESGFASSRRETTWITRMRILKEMGFIRSKDGPSGEFQHVLILNPYKVIRKLKNEGKIVNEDKFNALFQRALDIGAKKF